MSGAALARAPTRWLLAAFFATSGIAHFTLTEFFVAIMPPYIPYHLQLVWLSGAFELLGAAGLLLPRTRRWAGVGLLALTVAVFPANVHMALYPELFTAFAPWMLLARLPLQALIFAWIWWCALTRSSLPDG